MPYQLPSDLEHEFTLRVSGGRYETIEQVLRQALNAFDSRNREIAAIQEGVEAMNRGLMRPLREVDREFRATNHIGQDA